MQNSSTFFPTAHSRSLGIILRGMLMTWKWTFIAVNALLFVIIAAATAPMVRGNRTVVVVSGSMEPTIHTGAAVVAQPVATQNLQVGDIIVFSPNASAKLPFVHRIVSINDRDGVRYFRTRGDANGSEDTAEISLPATAWRVWYSVPFAGYLISFLTQPLGTILVIVVPGLILAALNGLDWLRKKKPQLLARL